MNMDYDRQMGDAVKRMQYPVKDLDNLDFCESLSWREFSDAMHEALNMYDASCLEAEKSYNEDFCRLCG